MDVDVDEYIDSGNGDERRRELDTRAGNQVADVVVKRHSAHALVVVARSPDKHRPEQDSRPVPDHTSDPRNGHQRHGSTNILSDAVFDGVRHTPVPIKTDERHVPGAGQWYDVIEQEEGKTSGPSQPPAAAQRIRRVDGDQQSNNEVGHGQI